MNKNITISDVAKYALVSKSTVSNYLNGKYERMAPKTKQKIEKAIHDLDYTPSLSARRLSAKEKSKTICLITPRNLSHVFDSAYFPTVFSAIGEESEKIGFDVLLYSRSGKDKGREVQYLKGLASSLIDGFIIFDLKKDDYYFKEFEKLDIPYVCVGKIPGYDDYNFVASDHGQGMTDALKYLFELGHKKVGVVAENRESVVEIIKYDAYEQLLKDRNMDMNQYYEILDAYSSEIDKYKICSSLITQKDAPTAIIVTSPLLHPLLKSAQDNNIMIPEDLSVVVVEYYNNNSISMGNVEFTRVESKAEKVSKLAFKKLLKQVYNRNAGFESCLEHLDLVVGDTTSRPKS